MANTSSKIPIILGAAGGLVGVAGIVVGIMLGTNSKPSGGFKLTLDAGEYGTIDGQRTKELDHQTVIQTAYSVKANVDYEFSGWYQDEAKTQAIEYPFNLSQDTTFYAKYIAYSPTTYTVSYDTGEGTAIPDTIVLKGESVSRPDTSFTGHVLVAWHEGSLEGPEVFQLKGSTYEPYTPTGSVILFAEWEEEEDVPTVTLNPSGGTLVGESSYTVRQLLYPPVATYDQYELLGWYEQGDVQQKVVTFPYDVPKDGVTLVAKWNRVAFNAGMYHGKTKETAVAYEGATWTGIKLLRYADIPEATESDIDTTGVTGSGLDYHNYEIEKWVDMDEGSTAEYPAGAVNITPLTKDTKLFAIWKHTKFNVTLHLDGEEPVTLTGLKKADLKTAPAIPDGWVDAHEASVGWYDGEGAGAQEITFPYQNELNADLNFYLKKEPSMGKVYLHVSDVPGSATYNGTEDWYYTEAYESRGSGFNKRGQPEVAYKQALGWARVDSDIGEDGRAPTIADIVPDNEWPVRPKPNQIAHLYPMYQDTHYKLTFITNGGSEVSDRMVEANKVVPTSDIPTTIKGGSQFLYWCTDQECTAQMDWTKEITGNKTLYAKFEEVAWKITYHYHYLGQDKTFVTDDWYKVIPDYNDAGGTETPQPKTGNAPFIGWSKIEGQNYPDSDLIGSTITGDTDLYAVFPDDSSTCTVTVMPNDAKWSDGSTDPKTFKAYKGFNPLTKQDDVFTFVGDTLTKEGASLNGWAKNSEGSLITYDYDLYENGTDIAEGKGRQITLYPNWKDHAIYQVTFDASPGYFKYYNTTSKSFESTRSYVYTVNENELGPNPTFATVYSAFLTSISTSQLTVTGPTNDGFELNLIEGAGWLAQGQKIQSDTTMDMIGAATLTANYVEKTASNWWTDDWYTISRKAEEGQTAFLAVEGYNTAYAGTDADGASGSATKAANSFVGLQRKVVMSDYSVTELRTRVIGVGQDTITNESKQALFTFDFIDCPITGAYSSSGNDYLGSNAFHKSTLRTLLKYALPDGLKSYMKTVNKNVIHTADSYDNTQVEAFQADLFLLSAYEVNGGTGTSKDAGGGSARVEYYKGVYGKTTPLFFTYQYYSGHTKDDYGSSHTTNAYRAKYYASEPIPWWLRSPAHDDSGWFPEGGIPSVHDSGAFYVTSNDESTSSKPYLGGIWCWLPSVANGISPAFCIGVQ